MRLKWVLLGVLAGVLIAAAAFSVYRRIAIPSGAARVSMDPPAVVAQIQQLSDLVSVKYVIQKVVGLEEAKFPVGSEKLLLIAQAEVLGGVALNKLTAKDIKASGEDWFVSLPAPEILHIVIDDRETKVWDRRVTWWTPWVPFSPDLERQARLAARESIKQAALEMGILEAAGRNAETSIRALLLNLGAKTVTFTDQS